MGETSDDPFAPLIGVHEDFVDKLMELEATLDEMMATRETREGNDIILDEAVRFFAEELMPHLRLEDEALLPALEMAIGRYGTLVTVIMSEHEEIRRGIGKSDAAPPRDDVHVDMEHLLSRFSPVREIEADRFAPDSTRAQRVRDFR